MYELEIIKVLQEKEQNRASVQDTYSAVMILNNIDSNTLTIQEKNRIENRIRFGRQNLVDAGLIYPPTDETEGVWELSEDGKKV